MEGQSNLNHPSNNKVQQEKMKSTTRNRSGATTRGRNAAANNGSYVMTAGFHGSETVKKTRHPHPHDVLCGRGGGINSHPGNKVFRDWVKERKNEYNLASSKAEKARVSKEIVDKVRALDPPGKFLQRDPTSSGVGGSSLSGWWLEIDDAKAMAKTSQALREGAPKIRADHAHEVEGNLPTTSQRAPRKRAAPAPVPSAPPAPSVIATPSPMPRRVIPRAMSPQSAVAALKHAAEMAGRQKDAAEGRGSRRKRSASQMAAPLMANADFAKAYSPAQAFRQDNKTARTDKAANDSNMAPTPPPAETETPPLRPVPMTIPGWPANTAFAIPQAAVNHGRLWEMPQKLSGMNRANSLALSDLGNTEEGLDAEFVNPFDEESEPGVEKASKKDKKSSLVRSLNSNSNSSHGDLGGIGALLNGPKLTQSDVPRQRSSGSLADKKLSSRSLSVTSDLSDLPDAHYHEPELVDFEEGMKSVYDAAHPGLTSPWGADVIPTHLFPFHGSSKKARRRRNQKFAPKGSDTHYWDNLQ